MVYALVPRLGYVPQVNLSRAFLHRAYDALQAGRVCEAGVLLREAVRRQLYAECCWKGCLPDDGNRRSPMALLNSLEKAGHVGYVSFEWTKEVIKVGNKCARCIPVRPSLVRALIAVWHVAIDNDPCGESPERTAKYKPVTEGCDVDGSDDDDSADWWKSEGGAT